MSSKIVDIDPLKKQAVVFRRDILEMLQLAGSGHPGGSLSAVEIMISLYGYAMEHKPQDPTWDGRDRLIMSKGHVTPVVYTTLANFGYIPKEELKTFRKFKSRLQGHVTTKVPGIEFNTGSLGHGLSFANGIALGARMRGKNFRTYCIMGDGEIQEGSVWEAAMTASHHKIDNVCAIIDYNKVQENGPTVEIKSLEPIGDKWNSFGWHTIQVDGHNFQELILALDEAKNTKGKPTVIIAHTVKGKGISFMEGKCAWHGKAPNQEQLTAALAELKIMEYKPTPTRDGFGEEVTTLGKTNPNIVVVSGDLEDATRAEYFKKEFPERFFNLGITEQDVVGTAAGLSTQGYVAFATSFAVFMTNRAYDMIRLDVCYNNTNVKVVCSHGGVTVGEDGASAQCLEDFAIMRVLPNIKVICPMDYIEAKKATRAIINEFGPFYMRTSRAPLPVLTTEETPFVIGKANVLRKGKDATIIACGVMVAEAMLAADKLKAEGIDVKVLNMHTIKPIDIQAIIDAVKETGAIVTAEEHQINGGLGSAVAEVVTQHAVCPIEMVAVRDSFGESGTPAQLMVHFGLKDTNIVEAVKKAIGRKKNV